MKEKCSIIIPGSYDPVTLGHLDIIKRASEKYEEVYAVVFTNPNKTYRFPVEDRARMLLLATEELENVLVSYSNGLVIDYMVDHEISKIIKGYRTELDLPWELEQAEWNKKHGGFDTELWKCREGLEEVSSTRVREALDSGASVENLLPKPVAEYIRSKTEKTG